MPITSLYTMATLNAGVSGNFIAVYKIFIAVFALVERVESTGLLSNTDNHTDEDLQAPITFKDLEGTNFRIYKRRFSWETAFIFCSRCVGQFATFATPDVANTVRDAIYSFSHFSTEYDEELRQEEFGLDRRYWLGLHDQKNVDGAWKWVKSTRQSPAEITNYDNYPWYTNQPDHHEPDSSNEQEHCGGFWNPVYHLDSKPTRLEKHTLNDMPCEQKYYFICEKDDTPPYTSLEPEFCKVPNAEKFSLFFGKDNNFLTLKKSNQFLEKDGWFENVTDSLT